MREHEAGRPRTPERWYSWIKRVCNGAAHLSAASLLASGMASSLAARNHRNRNDDRGARDQTERDRAGGNDRNREDRHANDPREDRRLHRENRDHSNGEGDGGHGHRGGNREFQADNSGDINSAASKQATATPTPTPTDGGGGGGGGGGGNNGGGNNGGGNNGGGNNGGGNNRGGGNQADGGGNEAGNAGSGFFDRPLATKARRRSNDFDHANQDDEHDGTFVDVHPDGESVYETGSVSFITSPDGLEIHTGNISYSAEATPPPEPLPRLELPEHEPGFPFGEDFPFGNVKVGSAPAASEPSDPGDSGSAGTTRAEPIVDSGISEPVSGDGGDNTMDFLS